MNPMLKNSHKSPQFMTSTEQQSMNASNSFSDMTYLTKGIKLALTIMK